MLSSQSIYPIGVTLVAGGDLVYLVDLQVEDRPWQRIFLRGSDVPNLPGIIVFCRSWTVEFLVKVTEWQLVMVAFIEMNIPGNDPSFG